MIQFAIEGAVATVTLARAPVNAIDEAWIARLHEVIHTAEREPAVVALLVRSSERAFSAGADLELMRSRFETPEGRAQMIEFVREMQHAYTRLEKSRLVSIAEIGGAAMGGGMELALACDLRIASSAAKLGLPEARLGLLPGAGGTQRLTLLCGAPVAKRLILGAEVVDGAQAAALGVVHWAVAKDELPAQARALAERVAALPAGALEACKRCIGAAGRPDHDGYGMELAATEDLLASSETQALVRAFLAGKR